LQSAAQSSDVRLQRLAARAVGRLERPALHTIVVPLLRAADATVRMEAVNALGQLKVPYSYAALLEGEKDPRVRAVIHETIGRVPPVPEDSERQLVAGLRDADEAARVGAMRGIEFSATRAVDAEHRG
jgi:HEAT repeat protein